MYVSVCAYVHECVCFIYDCGYIRMSINVKRHWSVCVQKGVRQLDVWWVCLVGVSTSSG